ncbi:hypothetical protein VKT23_001414 [Stygiomarasmius scandens]|uniref:deuterolysin n=1 Tax=Marasmiellus scandens TaxID=2682957 RepID=A0ABR1JYT9_9AGAR
MMFTLPLAVLFASFVAATPVKRYNGLDIKLTSASPSVNSIEDLVLTTEVTNTGTEAVKVLKYSTILDSLPTRSFSVSKNGTDVAFTGVKITINNVEDAYTTIASGETLVVSHSVADIFDFASAGAGTFSFTPRTEFKIAGAEDTQAQKVTVDVPTVDVEVNGVIARKAKRATNICEDATQAAFISAAESEGKELASIASDYISSNGASDSLYSSYWGSSPASTISGVFDRVANENDASRTLSCTDDFNVCDGNVIAYTVTSTTDIYFCDIFFDEVPTTRLCSGTSVASRNIRGGTVLHEVTHATSDTDDVTYGCANDIALSDSQARINADNYNCFSTQVYADTQC